VLGVSTARADEEAPAEEGAEASTSDKPAVASTGEFHRHHIFYSNYLVLRYNALGLQNLFDIGYQYWLYDDDRPLFRGSYVGVSVVPLITGAYAQIGAAVKVQPLAVLNLQARVSYMKFFNAFNLLQSFETASADFSDTAIKDRGEDGASYAADGLQIALIATLQGRIGPFIMRNILQGVYHDMNLEDNDGDAIANEPQRVWYDQYYDLMTPAKGWTLTNDLDLLWQFNEHLIAGLRYTVATPFYGDEDFLPGEDTENKNGPMQKVGPIAAYTFFDEPGAAFNKPTIILLVNWWLQHRWRTGEDVSQAIPYVVLGFAFSGDLLNP
jgi:hypothetical protein